MPPLMMLHNGILRYITSGMDSVQMSSVFAARSIQLSEFCGVLGWGVHLAVARRPHARDGTY